VDIQASVTNRDPEQTRERILEAAGQLFYRDGIRPVAMDAVAEAAGVTKKTLYYHLVVAYLDHMAERTHGALTRAASRRAGGPMARLLGLFEDLEGRLAHERFRGCPFVNAAAELASSEPARQAAARAKELTRAWFETGLVELGVDDPAGLSEQLMILTDGAVASWLVRRDPSAATRAREMAAILLRAAAPAAALARPEPHLNTERTEAR
jgi:AcrR family transcriptional regulator